MPSALLIGATGATGRHILTSLIANPEYTKVGEYGRKTTQFLRTPDKLVQKKVEDMGKIAEAEGIHDKWDVVIIALGTTRDAAGSAEAFVKIDRDYVIAAAAAAKSANDPDHKQRLIYISAGGANPSSPFLYPQSKGLTEQGLARLGYSDNIIFRPGFLANANRTQTRTAEAIFGKVTGFLSKFSDALEVSVGTLGEAAVKAGLLGSAALPQDIQASTVEVPADEQGKSGKFTLIGNAGALKLGGGVKA